MKTLLIETAYKKPKRYSVKNKLDTILVIGHNETIINKRHLLDVVDIIEYAYDNLLAEEGNILVRLEANDYGDALSNVFGVTLPALLENYIGLDRIEFIAQCINEHIPKEYCAIPFVETLLIGISLNKRPELKNKVRFISMPDKLVKLPDSDNYHPFYQWTFWDVPFTREECLAQEIFADIENSDILDLHNYNYVPLNNSRKNEYGIALGEFMELSKTNFQGVPQYWLDQERHYFGQTTFDLFTNYLIATEGSPDPNPEWQVIDDDAIVFNNQDPTKIESLLIVQPSSILIPDYLDARDCMTAIQVKQEWKERVDIAYLYLETRKPEFLGQFYYYLNLRAGVAINAATILKAIIRELPSIEVQREIVKKEKEKYFEDRKKTLKFHEEVLGINKGDISHSIGRPLDDIKILTKYLYEFFESKESPISIDTIIQECKEPPSYSIKIALDEINQHIKKAEDWISGLGPDLKLPLLKLNIYSLLAKYLEKYSLKDYKFLIRYDLSGLEETRINTNDNFGLILENFFSNIKRHAFKMWSENDIVDIRWCNVRFNGSNYLNLSISNNGTPMEISLGEFIAYRTKGEATGNTGIGGNEIYQIIKSYKGYLGLRKGGPDFPVTFDILLPIDDEYITNKIVKDYEPGEIE